MPPFRVSVHSWAFYTDGHAGDSQSCASYANGHVAGGYL
jgi:hypothetical protein